MNHKSLFPIAILALAFCLTNANAQSNSYQQTNLVSDMADSAAHTDPKLINPWGISFFPGQPFWIADNNSGYSTVYDANGVSQLAFIVPAPPGGASPSTPTGTVINTTSTFKVGGSPSLFLFDNEDGVISGWNGTGNAIIAIDNSSKNAVYKGLAMLSPADTTTYLAATNFNSGQVEAYTESFSPLAPPGSFTDPTLPAGYAPFNIQQVGNQVFVTYAVQDMAKHDPVNGAGNGIVDIFDLDGNFVKRFASNGTLNSPWGVVQASPSFGAFSNDILIGNFGDGTINAFDPATGNFLGQLKDPAGHVIANTSLWALVFGAGGTGDPNTLYFTAGLANEGHGLFGALAVNGGTGDYSLTASPQSATVPPGGSMNFMITVTPANGFASTVNFTCTAPTGITCALNPTSVTPAGSAVSTTLTANVSSGYGQVPPMAMLLSGLGLFGGFLGGARPRRRRFSSLLLAGLAAFVFAGTMLVSTGCGSYHNPMSGRQASVVVTATSGSLMHTTTINLTVQ